jgi:hypothetical protein
MNNDRIYEPKPLLLEMEMDTLAQMCLFFHVQVNHITSIFSFNFLYVFFPSKFV